MRFTYVLSSLLLACRASSANPLLQSLGNRAMETNTPAAPQDDTPAILVSIPATPENPNDGILENSIAATLSIPTATEMTQNTAENIIAAIPEDDILLVRENNTTALSGIQHDEPDPVRKWIVVLKEQRPTATQVANVSQFISSVTSTEPSQVWFNDTELIAFKINMTTAQAFEVKTHPDVYAVNYNLQCYLTEASHMPAALRSEVRPDILNSTAKTPSQVQWEVQLDAVTELRAISQPSGNWDLNLFRNYVYEQRSGAGIWIYHVELGVADPMYPGGGFPSIATPIICPSAAHQGILPGQDHSAHYHSTCTASKAIGQEYGISKSATLVPVVVAPSMEFLDVFEAFYSIADDIIANPSRRGHSVVTMSISAHRDLENDDLFEVYREGIRKVMEMDVPVVVAAGNNGLKLGQEHIDSYPSLWANDPNFPLIVVGSCDAGGMKSPWSQDGDQLTIYAVGQGITCWAPFLTPWRRSGTSFAAPEVAGQIANWLAMDTPPFDVTPGRVSRNVRDFLKNSPSAGWVRSPGGVRALWNGATEEVNKPFKVCNGLTTSKYVERDTLTAAIADFCNQALPQDFSKQYAYATMEDMTLSVRYDTWDNSMLSTAGCTNYLQGELTDGCDGASNPNNWKGGGTVTLKGVTFAITPNRVRQPATVPRLGSCTGNTQAGYTVWGRGWLSKNFGSSFQMSLTSLCNFDKTSWHFKYELRDDGREWTASFKIGSAFGPSCVTNAAKQAKAPVTFTC